MDRMMRATAVALIEEYRQRLNLVEWQIRLTDEPAADDTYAEIDRRETEKVATVRLNRDLPMEALQLSIAHELAHLVLFPVENIVHGLLTLAGDSERVLIHTLYEAAMERAIDQLALALTPPSTPRFVAFGKTAETHEPWRLRRDHGHAA